jgi:NAD(P)-dependent dehydrogenase (short-subunit alcohol dehydrogenase family)
MVSQINSNKEQVAVITGAGSFIGLSIVQKLVECDVTVIACDFQDHMPYLQEKFNDVSKVILAPGDLTDDSYIESIFSTVHSLGKGLDYLVAGAASFAEPGRKRYSKRVA